MKKGQTDHKRQKLVKEISNICITRKNHKKGYFWDSYSEEFPSNYDLNNLLKIKYFDHML